MFKKIVLITLFLCIFLISGCTTNSYNVITFPIKLNNMEGCNG